MPRVAKLIVAVLLFLSAALCIFGYINEKLVDISFISGLVISALCAGTFVFFAFFDPDR